MQRSGVRLVSRLIVACVLTALPAGLAAAEPGQHKIWVRFRGSDLTMARVEIVGSDGKAYAPEGRTLRRMKSGQWYFYAPGDFEVTVPNGKTRLRFSGGIEVVPHTVNLDRSSYTRLSVHLRPWVNMASKGWHSGDSHTHLHTGGPLEVDVADAAVAARAEGLNYLNLCVSNNVGDDVRDAHLITGKPSSSGRHLVMFGEEMRSRIYGHMQFIGIKKVVRPLYTGFDDTRNPFDFPANYKMAAEAVKQGGLVTYGHPMFAGQPFPFDEDLSKPNAAARELPVDAIMNVVQAVDLMCYNSDEDLSAQLWYRLLNCGLKLSACAGTDALLDRSTDPVGGCRVYVKGSTIGMGSWVHSLRQGRSFVTNGPMLQLEVNERPLGDTVGIRPGSVHVNANVMSRVPFDRVEVIVNGKVAVEKKVKIEDGSATVHIQQFQTDIPLKRSSWVALRVRGPDHPDVFDGPVWAHTSPVYIQVNGEPIRSAEDAQYFVDWIGQLLKVVAARNQYASAEDRQQVEALFRKAQDLYRERAK